MKKNGNIIPEFNHLKNLIFLLITLIKVLCISYLKVNKIITGVNDLFIFLDIGIKKFLKINFMKRQSIITSLILF